MALQRMGEEEPYGGSCYCAGYSPAFPHFTVSSSHLNACLTQWFIAFQNNILCDWYFPSVAFVQGEILNVNFWGIPGVFFLHHIIENYLLNCKKYFLWLKKHCKSWERQRNILSILSESSWCLSETLFAIVSVQKWNAGMPNSISALTQKNPLSCWLLM